ncbi:MAG TPA: YceI family protein [Pseudonocardia sp.]|uniref:YceI family protein n=1 Tax=Pseudonocardia sp. TaxID=60912 RepID=UPI002C26D685|nr:YceI family protein [Pseudonocardia sp.]HTF50089.1 YceI family protein [Pseudonocardia sp.]
MPDGGTVIDPAHSAVSFAAWHTMLGKMCGRFTSFSGQVLTGEQFPDFSVTISVDLGSVSTGVDERDECIRSIGILDVARYPTMTYRSTGLCDYGGPFVLEGWLTVHGVTRFVPLELEVALRDGSDADGGTRCGFRAIGTINLGDFGVGINVAAPGGVLVSDEVELQLAIYQTLIGSGDGGQDPAE